MTVGEKLLALTLEYQRSVENRRPEYADIPGPPLGREPEEIGAEYEDVLRNFLTG